MQSLNFYPGQKATVYLETVHADGYRADSATQPIVARIIFPDLSLASGFPQNMTKLDTGLYYYQFVLPAGASSVGSYLVDTQFTNPTTNAINNQAYQILVAVNLGFASISPG